MGKLWVLMTEMYGHKWTSVHGESDASETWGKVLHGIDGPQMAAGMKALALSSDPWPPSAPEFRALCEAGRSSLGIPDPAAAWREAIEASTNPTVFKFSHFIVHEAGRLTGWFDIRTGGQKAETLQNRFFKRYAELTAKLQRGEPLSDHQALLNHESCMSALEQSDRANEFLINQRIRDQGLAGKSPAELRAELRAKLGLKP